VCGGGGGRGGRLGVCQANARTPELRPIAAQILRCLQLMAAGDEEMQVRVLGRCL
jgi:hypothetical protein